MITLNEYRKLASRTFVDLGSHDKNRQHIILGIISEIGELADAYKKNLAYGKDLDKTNVSEEWADTMWYIANFFNMTNTDIKDPDENLLICKYSDDIYNEHCIGREVQDKASDLLFHFLVNLHLGDNRQHSLIDTMFAIGIHLGFTKEELYKSLENNINKLKVRYKDKFTEEEASTRDLQQERKELEK